MPDFQQRFGDAIPEGGFILSPVRQSEITSLLSAGVLSAFLLDFLSSCSPVIHHHQLGTFVGALAQAFTADSMGRKGSVLFWSFIFTM